MQFCLVDLFSADQCKAKTVYSTWFKEKLNIISNKLSSAKIGSDQFSFSLLLLFGAHASTPCIYVHGRGSSQKAIGYFSLIWMVLFGLVSVWFGLVWFGFVWFGLVLFGLVWGGWGG